MTIARRAASRRGVAAVVASLALAAGLVGTFAAPSSADEGGSGEYQGPSEFHVAVKGHTPDGKTWSPKAGLLNLQVEGSSSVDLSYCVDLIDRLDEGKTIPEAPWDESAIANRDAVERILNSYFPIGVGPEGYEIEGTDSEKAAATQAAIWHFTNGFELESSSGHPAVVANYQTILKAVADGVLPALGGPVTLSIDGDTDIDAIPGQLIGPFTIHTSAASVDLTPSTGVTLHNAGRQPVRGPRLRRRRGVAEGVRGRRCVPLRIRSGRRVRRAAVRGRLRAGPGVPGGHAQGGHGRSRGGGAHAAHHVVVLAPPAPPPHRPPHRRSFRRPRSAAPRPWRWSRSRAPGAACPTPVPRRWAWWPWRWSCWRRASASG